MFSHRPGGRFGLVGRGSGLTVLTRSSVARHRVYQTGRHSRSEPAEPSANFSSRQGRIAADRTVTTFLCHWLLCLVASAARDWRDHLPTVVDMAFHRLIGVEGVRLARTPLSPTSATVWCAGSQWHAPFAQNLSSSRRRRIFPGKAFQQLRDRPQFGELVGSAAPELA